MRFISILTLILILTEVAKSQTSCSKIDNKDARLLSGKIECGFIVKVCEFKTERKIEKVDWSEDQFYCNIDLIDKTSYEYEVHCSCEGNSTVIMDKILTYKLHDEEQEDEIDLIIIILPTIIISFTIIVIILVVLAQYFKK